MLSNDNLSGVSNCYVFKSRLQEYAQKAGLQTPIYETIKEGPSHEPSFRSAVILKDVRYESLPGFFNRKAAEQSAAEVALTELAKAGEVNQRIAMPIQETGLCKNLLQEYAQKMNYAIPVYKCDKDGLIGRVAGFKCTVDLGGIQYIGGVAKTKKEAEIKAARTALLAIQAGASSDKTFSNNELTVIPSKKKGAEIPAVSKETTHAPKAKKARFKKKFSKKKFSREKTDLIRGEIRNLDSVAELNPLSNHNDADTLPEGGFRPSDPEVTMKSQDGQLAAESNEKEQSVVGGSSTSKAASICNGKPCVPAEHYRNFYMISSPASTVSNGDTNKVTRIEEVARMGVELRSTEESESRREEIKAMRAESIEEAGASGTTSLLANPLLETPSVPQFGTQRFDFCTDPMASFFANSPMQGAGNPSISSYPPIPMSEGARPEAWRGVPPYGGMNPPYPMNQGFGENSSYGGGRGDWFGGSRGNAGVHQNFRQGRGQWRHMSPKHGVPRGGGRGRGFHFHGSVEGETIGSDRYFNKSMFEDPWQNLQPVEWKGLHASNSLVSNYICMKKPTVLEPSPGEGSSIQQQSVAAPPAASFNEAANAASSV